MTDALLPVNASAADRRFSVSASPGPPFGHHHLHHGHIPATVDGVGEEDDGEIACICAYNDDDGNTIQCDKCLRWQHILCYYPPPAEVPMGEDEKHFCIDCTPRDLDARKATERQRKALEQRSGFNGVKRPPAKSHKKKLKDSPSTAGQVNGWGTDRHSHLHAHDRKSASPRDQPPPAKRPKTSHRASNAAINPVPTRKRNGVSTLNPNRSPSKSPELAHAPGPILQWYSEDFLHLFQPESPQVETDTNLMNNIAVTNSLSEWLTDSEAVAKATGGLSQSEIFKRWDGRIEEIPGRPEVDLRWAEDPSFTSADGSIPRWACLAVNEQITPGTFIGELKGRVGHREEYLVDPDNRWAHLQHPEPFVFFHPQLPICIDARQEGSIFRFVRRSCQPNAELQTIITEGTEYHFCFMASKEILPGEEVTIAWQIPDSIGEIYHKDRPNSGDLGTTVRDYISTWVSKVLANCGPCACSGNGNCLMGRFDRRGHPQPPEYVPLKPTKGRKKRIHHASPLEISRASHSRSGSEIRKFEQDDDMTESRSVSGSRGSASRDITPSTHYSGRANGVGPELSERERKKLMREEEMFRKQEQDNGKRGKKRNSGGPNLNTPGVGSSVRSTKDRVLPKSHANRVIQKLSGHLTNGHFHHADAGTSHSRPETGRTSSGGKRSHKSGLSGQSSRSLAKSSSHSSNRPKPVYVNTSVQCDMDAEEATQRRESAEPRKTYLSVTQRLLRRCMTNNFKRKADASNDQATPSGSGSDAMDVDPRSGPPPMGEESLIKSPVVTNNVVPAHASAAPDVDMEEAEPEQAVKTEPPAPSDMPAVSTNDSPADRLPSNPPSDPPAPPWPVGSSQDSSVASPSSHRSMDMHVDMPPPSTNPFAVPVLSTSTSQSTAFAQSPAAYTPGLTPGGHPVPFFSPAVTAAVAPSPARKKMSLSDYTRRSKARESDTMPIQPDSSPAAGSSSNIANAVADVIERGQEAAEAAGGSIMQGSAVASPSPSPLMASGLLPEIEDDDDGEEGQYEPPEP